MARKKKTGNLKKGKRNKGEKKREWGRGKKMKVAVIGSGSVFFRLFLPFFCSFFLDHSGRRLKVLSFLILSAFVYQFPSIRVGLRGGAGGGRDRCHRLRLRQRRRRPDVPEKVLLSFMVGFQSCMRLCVCLFFFFSRNLDSWVVQN